MVSLGRKSVNALPAAVNERKSYIPNDIEEEDYENMLVVYSTTATEVNQNSLQLKEMNEKSKQIY